MKSRYSSIYWKVYRETRGITLKLMAALVSLSAVLALVLYSNLTRPFHEAVQFTLIFGDFIAIILGTSVIGRQSHEKLQYFWLSRPILVQPYVRIHFLGGLAALLLILLTPIFLQARWWTFLLQPDWQTSRTQLLHEDLILVAPLPTVMATYSIAFALAVLLRGAVGATLVALAAGLLLYFAPSLVPGLHWMDPFRWTDSANRELTWSQYASYFLGSMAVSGFAYAATIIAFQKGSHWKLTKRSLCWTLGTVMLLLFAGASLQLGSNIQGTTIQSPELRNYGSLVPIDDEHVVVCYTEHPSNALTLNFDTLLLTPPKFELQPKIRLDIMKDSKTRPLIRYDRSVVASPFYPQLLYTFHETYDSEDFSTEKNIETITRSTLDLVALDISTGSVLDRLDVTSIFPARAIDLYLSEPQGLPQLFRYGSSLFAMENFHGEMDREIKVFDLSTTGALTYRSGFALRYSGLHIFGSETSGYSVELPSIPGLEPHDQLAAAIALFKGSNQGNYVRHNDLLIHAGKFVESSSLFDIWRITGYGQDKAGNPIAKVEPLGKYTPTLIGGMVGSHVLGVSLSQNTLFVRLHALTEGIEAYDISDPGNPIRLGYYTTPDLSFKGNDSLLALPGGRALVGGSQLHRVGPVRR